MMAGIGRQPPLRDPLISVIVPVYNVAAHVGACLASLRAQILTDFEAIIIDDGSTDDSAAMVRAAIGDDPRFRMVRRDNGGLSAARNTGLDLARGEFIAFLDSDDQVAPGWLWRMHQALAVQGGDWVATGVRFLYPDGGSAVHSAQHGAPALGEAPDPPLIAQVCDLRDWRDVIRHFPSAWNKLYRRRLIGEIRFDERLWYEDHAFFWRLACRTGHLLHLPEPLYLHLRDRPGQITGNGGERVFEQFTVLETLAEIRDAAPPERQGGHEALARLSTRLIEERLAIVTDPDRRARFKAAALDFMTRHALPWSDDWDQTLSRGTAFLMHGGIAFSIVIPSDGDLTALQASLASLASQPVQEFEALVVPSCPEAEAALICSDLAGIIPQVRILPFQGRGLPDCDPQIRAEHQVCDARNAGLKAARGLFCLFLDAGDQVLPGALWRGLDLLLRYGPGSENATGRGADIGLAAFRMGMDEGAFHSGWHDASGYEAFLHSGLLPADPVLALRLHAMPSARFYCRGFLSAHGLAFRPGPLQSWDFMIRALFAVMATPEGRILHMAVPVALISEAARNRRFLHMPVSPARLAAAVQAMMPNPQPAGLARAGRSLPAGAAGRLFARAVWEKVSFACFEDPVAPRRFLAEAGEVAHHQGLLLGDAGGDPGLGPDLTAALSPRN